LLGGEPADDLSCHGICPCGDLLRSLVLDRVLDVNSIKAGSAQSSGLNTRSRHEFSCGDGNRGNAKILELDGVVQTARCARPSIRETFNHRVEATKLVD
jgi:hypothetical protein